MNGSVRVSVIVPMYNAEAFADALLCGLRGQTLREIEIICVDDGSTDATGEIIARHAAADERVRGIRQDNGGAGSARNLGLSMAMGAYCICLDADDCYRSDMLQVLLAAAEDSDADVAMCLFEIKNHWLGTTEKDVGFDMHRLPVGRAFHGKDVPGFFHRFTVGPTNKLYRTGLIRENALQYSTTQAANDVFFTLAALISAQRIICVPQSLITVHQHINENSISSKRALHLTDVVRAYAELSDWMACDRVRGRYVHQIADAFRISFHYNARYGANPAFIEAAAKLLTEKPPWSSMRLVRVCERMRLNPTPIRNGIVRVEAALRTAGEPEREALACDLRMRKNELESVGMLVEALRVAMDFGPEGFLQRTERRLRAPLFRVVWCLEDHGVAGTVRLMLARIIKKK